MSERGFEPEWIEALRPYEGKRIYARCGRCNRVAAELSVTIMRVGVGAEAPLMSYVSTVGRMTSDRTDPSRVPRLVKTIRSVDTAGKFRTEEIPCLNRKCGAGPYRRNIFALRGDFLRCVRTGEPYTLI